MYRIKWRDPSKRRNYAGFRFDENGVSVRSWKHLRLGRLATFFRLNQNRQMFEAIEFDPLAAVVPAPETTDASGGGEVVEASPPPSADPEVAADDDSDSDERGGCVEDAEGLGAEVPEVHEVGVRPMGEEGGGSGEDRDAALEDRPVEEVNQGLRDSARPKPGRGGSRSGKARKVR